MRRITQPGPALQPRIDIAQSEGRKIDVVLEPGVALEEAVARATQAFSSAWLEIRDAPVDALEYVIPAASPDDAHVAWYSDPRGFSGPGQIDHLGMVVGRHRGASFLHGHGLWTPKGAAQAMGHILAQRTILSQPVRASGIGLMGARFERLPDAETNFELFQAQGGGGTGRFAALRIKPNQDFATALDAACTALGWTAVRACGLGSLIGAEFESGEVLDSLPSEFLITDAKVGCDEPEPEIVIVGVDGGKILSGRLIRGQNPVLITAEVILSRSD